MVLVDKRIPTIKPLLIFFCIMWPCDMTLSGYPVSHFVVDFYQIMLWQIVDK